MLTSCRIETIKFAKVLALKCNPAKDTPDCRISFEGCAFSFYGIENTHATLDADSLRDPAKKKFSSANIRSRFFGILVKLVNGMLTILKS
jgi:hypothetical protein